MLKSNSKSVLMSIASIVLIVMNSQPNLLMGRAQGVKGGSSSFSLNSISSGQQFQQPTKGSQLSLSFMEMFNSLTPTEQQQFFKEISSSNRKTFQSILPQTSNFLTEEVSSSSSGAQSAGTKSGSSFSKQVSSSQILSPIQQQQQQVFLKQQKSQSIVQPAIQPTSTFSFSRQVSSSAIQPQQIILPQTTQNEQANFQSTKNVAQPQTQQQQSFFNEIKRVQQVVQPVVMPTREQSFRRVQQFSSQPLPFQQEASSGFTSSQFSQQIRPQPSKTSSSSFRRDFRQMVVQQPQPVVSNSFSSVSSSSNLAAPASGFDSVNLQQEKVDFSQPSQVTIGGGQQFEQFSQTQNNGFTPNTIGSFESSQLSQSSGFDSSDVQQKNVPVLAINDDFGSGTMTAASINNKWYIMRPVENPSALGLGDARAASGSVRQVTLPINISAQQRAELTSHADPSAATRVSSSSTRQNNPVSSPKKRSVNKVDKAVKEKEQRGPESSSLLEPDGASESNEEGESQQR